MRTTYIEQPARSALNRVSGMMFNWSLNPYTGCAHRCTFCYVRAFEKRADRPSDDRYGRAIRVKTNLVELLRQELARPSWKREEVVIGAATDPYQPPESRYKLTRGAISVLAAAHTPFGIITRGPMIMRDVDVLADAAKRVKVRINVSIPSLDRRIVKTTEPGTAPPRQRLRAVKLLVDAGLDVGVALAPILPGLSDDPAGLSEVLKAAREHGATRVWATPLNLRPGTREHFLEALARDWPELLGRYEGLYARNAYLSKEETSRVQSQVAGLARVHEIADRRTVRLTPPPEPAQLGLWPEAAERR
ncbi:MAG: radical SAM protein [Candidatus Eiseniibacteriota bacterium]